MSCLLATMKGEASKQIFSRFSPNFRSNLQTKAFNIFHTMVRLSCNNLYVYIYYQSWCEYASHIVRRLMYYDFSPIIIRVRYGIEQLLGSLQPSATGPYCTSDYFGDLVRGSADLSLLPLPKRLFSE